MLEEVLDTSGKDFAEALERYLGETLHDRVRVHRFRDLGNLPIFLERAYDFYECKLVGRQCVFIVAGESIPTPSEITKHVALVRSAIDDAVVVFAAASLNAYNRSRLIAQTVAFVVPGNQLYIPELAMDLREHFRAPRPRSDDGLSPAAQAVLFHHILCLDERATTPSAIAKRLRYSAMSMGRAFDELVAAGLAKTGKRGKEKHLRFTADRRVLLDASHSLLRSPVRSVKYIRSDRVPDLKRAGETALAELTDLSRPRTDTYATAASDWKAIAKAYDLVEAGEIEADFAVETWSYNPAGLSAAPTVDPLSLYAQFRDHRDERVSMAAERLLENVSW